jgi:hypothetical protein
MCATACNCVWMRAVRDGDERPTPPLTRKLIREKLTTDAVERTVEFMRYAMTLARLLERHALCKRVGPCGIQY